MTPLGQRGIKAISFDGDMTLWDFEEAMRRALGVVLAELRRCADTSVAADMTVEAMIAIRDETAEELRDRTFDLGVVRREAMSQTVARALGRPDGALARRLTELYFAHRYNVVLFPDVLRTLDALGTHYRLGLVSNGNTPPQRCGLGGRFDFVVFPRHVEAVKPEAKVFHAACARAGCTPAQLLHVGDSLQDDVRGANGAGAVSVWLNRDGRVNETCIEPTAEISSLAQLAGLLGP